MALMRLVKAITLLFLILTCTNCNFIRNLRAELEEDDLEFGSRAPVRSYAEDFRAVPNKLPPPPATVQDARSTLVAGTPVDLSGTRIKTGRVTRQDFISEGLKNENSLWSEEGQTNYLFSRNKLRMPGDLITIVIEDDLRTEMINSVRKLLPPELRDSELRVPSLIKEKKRSVAGAPGAATQGQQAEEHDPEDTITAEVLERYPNGNVRLRGIKRVPFKRRILDIEVISIARAADISEQDVVKSSRFFERRVEIYR